MKRKAKSAPKMTPELRARMMQAIAEEEQPRVIAATKKQAREVMKKRAESNSDPVSELLAAIRTERDRQHLSLADLAERTGIDRGNLSRTLRGEHNAATIERLSRIAAAVGGKLSLTLVMK